MSTKRRRESSSGSSSSNGSGSGSGSGSSSSSSDEPKAKRARVTTSTSGVNYRDFVLEFDPPEGAAEPDYSSAQNDALTLDSNDVELWLLNFPRKKKSKLLAGIKVDVIGSDAVPTVTVDGYTVKTAEPGVYDGLIPFLPSKEEGAFVPGKRFARAFEIVRDVEPPAAAEENVVKSVPVVPREGLKRVYQPLGFGSTAPLPASSRASSVAGGAGPNGRAKVKAEGKVEGGSGGKAKDKAKDKAKAKGKDKGKSKKSKGKSKVKKEDVGVAAESAGESAATAVAAKVKVEGGSSGKPKDKSKDKSKKKKKKKDKQ